MLMITLDSNESSPAYSQIRDRIVALIDEGTLRPGDRVPPTRALAASVGVHRSTVVRAYEEVRALGYLESRPGSYTTVRRRARVPTGAVPPAAGAAQGVIDWPGVTFGPPRAADPGDSRPSRPGTTADIDFRRLAADPRLAPVDDLRRIFGSLLTGRGSKALDYGEPAGWRPLREAVATRLRAHGVGVSAEEVLITAGAQQGLDLVLRLLTRPGDRVAVERPTYGMAHALLRLHQLEPVEIAVGEAGMDLELLEDELERKGAKLVYTMPNFHNPTGVTTDQAHRERLLAACERFAVPLVEDGFEEEMKYLGKAVLPIKSMDTRGVVLYLGSLSKVAFPGLRVGWIVAPPGAMGSLTGLLHASCLATHTLDQAAVERFFARGAFERHLRRAHRVYRRRMQTLVTALGQHLPGTTSWTNPVGGYTSWLTLPGTAENEPGWCDRFAAAGVLVTPGREFYAAPPARPHVRLSIATVDEQAICEGCARLGSVLGRR